MSSPSQSISPHSPNQSRHDGASHRPPFPHTIEVSFDPSGTTPATLIFNFTHSARNAVGDATKAAAFHTTSPIQTFYDDSHRCKIVHVPYPRGLNRVYFARAGNVGLEFESEECLRLFHHGILGVGHVVVKGEEGIFRMYLGDKVREGRGGYVAQGGEEDGQDGSTAPGKGYYRGGGRKTVG